VIRKRHQVIRKRRFLNRADAQIGPEHERSNPPRFPMMIQEEEPVFASVQGRRLIKGLCLLSLLAPHQLFAQTLTYPPERYGVVVALGVGQVSQTSA
jgi:hypothetical protein